MLPRSAHTRSPRETTAQARVQEIRRLIGRSLRAAVDLQVLGKRQVIVDCDVLQADVGTSTASVTGWYVALALALREANTSGSIEARVPLAPVAAMSAGVLDGELLLDLCYTEDVRGEMDMDVVMNPEG